MRLLLQLLSGSEKKRLVTAEGMCECVTFLHCEALPGELQSKKWKAQNWSPSQFIFKTQVLPQSFSFHCKTADIWKLIIWAIPTRILERLRFVPLFDMDMNQSWPNPAFLLQEMQTDLLKNTNFSLHHFPSEDTVHWRGWVNFVRSSWQRSQGHFMLHRVWQCVISDIWSSTLVLLMWTAALHFLPRPGFASA